MRVAVAGGTGAAGAYVVKALTEKGHEPVVMARSRGIDLLTGKGLAEALAGADAVIDTANVTTTSRRKARAFFETAGRNLLAAEREAGVRHHVTLSIVGMERVRYGYYDGKLLQEQLVRDGGVPWTVLRATQFHEFPGQLLARIPGPLAVMPQMRSQPVAVREVAEHLVELVAGPPLGMAPEMAGPQVEEMPDLARRLLRARGSSRRVWAPRMPGAAGRAMAEGALLPDGPGPRGTLTFDQWLASDGR